MERMGERVNCESKVNEGVSKDVFISKAIKDTITQKFIISAQLLNIEFSHNDHDFKKI